MSKAIEVTDKKLTVAELHIIVKNLQQDYVTVVTALADTVMELKAKVMELENANNSTLSHEALQKAVTDEVEAAVDSKCTSLKDELREDRDKKIEEEVKTHTVLNEEALVDKVAGKVQASWADVVAGKSEWPSLQESADEAAKPGKSNSGGRIIIPPHLRSQVHGVMDDAREAELRMANFIIRDLPEPVTNDTDQIRSAEILEIKKIFDTCEVQIQDADIISIERIGDKDNKPNNRARLLKVKLRDANLKRPLFRNLHKFREYQLNLRREGDDGQGPDQIPLVSVDHDMTLAQREYKKALIAKAQDDSRVGPRKFRVRGPPWKLVIVEIAATSPTATLGTVRAPPPSVPPYRGLPATRGRFPALVQK